MKTPSISAGSLSRLLSRAGLPRSETYTSRIRGWRNRSNGFFVKKSTGGDILVHVHGRPEMVTLYLEQILKTLKFHHPDSRLTFQMEGTDTIRVHPLDNCEQCGGAKGGVRGNENVVNGLTLCDYCSGSKNLPDPL